MTFEKVTTDKEYTREVLKSLLFFGLTNLELDILCAMLDNNLTIVNIDSREIIRKVLNKDKFITNNYIKRLRNKGVFLDKTDSKMFYINPLILEILDKGEINFKFTVHDN